MHPPLTTPHASDLHCDVAASEHAHPALDLEHLKGRWAKYLRRQHLKTTQQRELIVDEFFRSPGHISVEELLARVRVQQGHIGYATVYRTLKLLAESGLAATRQFGDGQTRYEVADEHHHDHLICQQCGLILEFENPEIEQLQDEVAERLGGFKVVRHKLELYGLCPRAQGIENGFCPNETRKQS
jgi:Fur family ferric uptake transcriptional regulator